MATIKGHTADLASTAPINATTAVVLPISIKEMLAKLDGVFPMDPTFLICRWN
jgi:hypothetical protein